MVDGLPDLLAGFPFVMPSINAQSMPIPYFVHHRPLSPGQSSIISTTSSSSSSSAAVAATEAAYISSPSPPSLSSSSSCASQSDTEQPKPKRGRKKKDTSATCPNGSQNHHNPSNRRQNQSPPPIAPAPARPQVQIQPQVPQALGLVSGHQAHHTTNDINISSAWKDSTQEISSSSSSSSSSSLSSLSITAIGTGTSSSSLLTVSSPTPTLALALTPTPTPTLTPTLTPAPDSSCLGVTVKQEQNTNLKMLPPQQQQQQQQSSAQLSTKGTAQAKRQERLIKNRAAALLSRKRKREHLNALEDQRDALVNQNKTLEQTVAELELKLSSLEKENQVLKEERVPKQEEPQSQQQSTKNTSKNSTQILTTSKTTGMVFMIILFSFAMLSMPTRSNNRLTVANESKSVPLLSSGHSNAYQFHRSKIIQQPQKIPRLTPPAPVTAKMISPKSENDIKHNGDSNSAHDDELDGVLGNQEQEQEQELEQDQITTAGASSSDCGGGSVQNWVQNENGDDDSENDRRQPHTTDDEDDSTKSNGSQDTDSNGDDAMNKVLNPDNMISLGTGAQEGKLQSPRSPQPPLSTLSLEFPGLKNNVTEIHSDSDSDIEASVAVDTGAVLGDSNSNINCGLKRQENSVIDCQPNVKRLRQK
ncbi:hypothetical protein F4703DRAFT_1865329 [Phycomyces blakesleeanus]